MPLDKLICRGTPILSPEGDEVRVAFQYKWLLGLCFHCGLLVHEAKTCKNMTLKVGEESPHGEAMPGSDTPSPPQQQATEVVAPQTSDSPVTQSHQDGKLNSHGIDGVETTPQQNFNSSNGHSYHSMTIIEERNLDITEVLERIELNGTDINEEQYSDINDGKNPKINAGMLINLPIMYVDNGVSNVYSLECETLAH